MEPLVRPPAFDGAPPVPTMGGPWPPRRSRRIWPHAALFGLTFFTATFSGSLWEGAFPAESLGGLAFRVATEPWRLAAGLPFSLALLAILLAHEFGHYLACQRYGIAATLPFFIPGPPPFGTFGAVIRIRGTIPSRRALFDIAAAGPLAGFAVAFPILLYGLLTATRVGPPLPEGGIALGSPLLVSLLEHGLRGEGDLVVGSVYVAGWFGMLVTSMNLFPVGQLDGGHAVYALSRRWHRRLSRWTLAGVAVFVVAQTWIDRTVSAYTFWCAVLFWMRDRHPRLADESRPLDPWRRAGVAILLLLFAACFIPVPLSL